MKLFLISFFIVAITFVSCTSNIITSPATTTTNVETRPSTQDSGNTNSQISGSNDTSTSTVDNFGIITQDVSDVLSIMDQAIEETYKGITPEDEYFIGRAVAANVLRNYRPYSAKPALTQYVNKICAAIAFNSDRPTIFNGYHVMIIDSPEFNGFATSGGHIFITRGLVDALNSEDALAAVIAHEIAHIQLRHGITLIEDSRLSREFEEMAARARNIAERRNVRNQEFASSVREIVNKMVVEGYSQSQEFEADTLAVQLMIRAGYNPTAMRDVLRILAGQPTMGFGRTHPSPASRILNVDRVIAQYTFSDTQSARRSRFSAAIR